ncbi:hypothetical protein AYO20_05160 [Fonsecaea nubica]|uniref:Uncharacterized protein n=1 Tax=Fonsecaea nubica TaxID=856822 RepID=A0A178D2Z4_9EURO|nr:hypothetical protein AYO20_05160 [Fonsecaea nubica]OAL35541.1 hypothetical protein AYO20_05160 [Fonsecaea nubica]
MAADGRNAIEVLPSIPVGRSPNHTRHFSSSGQTYTNSTGSSAASTPPQVPISIVDESFEGVDLESQSPVGPRAVYHKRSPPPNEIADNRRPFEYFGEQKRYTGPHYGDDHGEANKFSGSTYQPLFLQQAAGPEGVSGAKFVDKPQTYGRIEGSGASQRPSQHSNFRAPLFSKLDGTNGHNNEEVCKGAPRITNGEHGMMRKKNLREEATWAGPSGENKPPQEPEQEMHAVAQADHNVHRGLTSSPPTLAPNGALQDEDDVARQPFLDRPTPFIRSVTRDHLPGHEPMVLSTDRGRPLAGSRFPRIRREMMNERSPHPSSEAILSNPSTYAPNKKNICRSCHTPGNGLSPLVWCKTCHAGYHSQCESATTRQR